MVTEVSPQGDRRLQQRLARGEASALAEVYDRFASLVHALAHRVLGDHEAADALTVEVFTLLWQRPEAYDPARSGLRAWLAELTQRLAVERLRRTEVAALVGGGDGTSEDLDRKVRGAAVAARADYLVTSMPAPLRDALELAHFRRLDCRRTAAELGVPEEEARRRLRLGLQLLATAHDDGPSGPAYGRVL